MTDEEAIVRFLDTDHLRVVVADADPWIRDALTDAVELQKDFALAGSASSGREAAQLFRRVRPDAAVLDGNLKVYKSISAVKVIRREFPQAHLIATADTEEEREQFLKDGASASILKSSPPQVWLSIIRNLCADIFRARRQRSGEGAVIQHQRFPGNRTNLPGAKSGKIE